MKTDAMKQMSESAELLSGFIEKLTELNKEREDTLLAQKLFGLKQSDL